MLGLYTMIDKKKLEEIIVQIDTNKSVILIHYTGKPYYKYVPFKADTFRKMSRILYDSGYVIQSHIEHKLYLYNVNESNLSHIRLLLQDKSDLSIELYDKVKIPKYFRKIKKYYLKKPELSKKYEIHEFIDNVKIVHTPAYVHISK